jgi:hypothetical protein
MVAAPISGLAICNKKKPSSSIVFVNYYLFKIIPSVIHMQVSYSKQQRLLSYHHVTLFDFPQKMQRDLLVISSLL